MLWKPSDPEDEILPELLDPGDDGPLPDCINPDEVPEKETDYNLMAEVDRAIARVSRHMTPTTTDAGQTLESVKYSVFGDTKRTLDLIQEISDDGLTKPKKGWRLKWDIPEELLPHFEIELGYNPITADEDEHKRFERSDDPLARACQIKYKKRFF